MGQHTGNPIPNSTIRIPLDLKEEMRRIAESRNMTMTEAILEAMRLYIDWHE